MNRIIRSAALVPAAVLALAVPASASSSTAYRAGSCTAEGDYAVCDASGTATSGGNPTTYAFSPANTAIAPASR